MGAAVPSSTSLLDCDVSLAAELESDDEPEDDEAELEDDDSESPTDRTPAPSSLPHPAATRLNVPKIHKR